MNEANHYLPLRLRQTRPFPSAAANQGLDEAQVWDMKGSHFHKHDLWHSLLCKLLALIIVLTKRLCQRCMASGHREIQGIAKLV